MTYILIFCKWIDGRPHLKQITAPKIHVAKLINQNRTDGWYLIRVIG